MSKSQLHGYSRIITKPTSCETAPFDQSLSELIDSSSHELNNNIAVALGHVQLLKLKIKDKKITEGLNRIEKSIFKCGEIIRAVQGFSMGPDPRTETSATIADSLEAALGLDETGWRENASVKNLTIVSIITGGLGTIDSDENDLITAISHLIQNAVEASPQNGAIEIKVREENDLAILSVADIGDGNSDTSKLKTYESLASSKKSKASGLGVTIVQSIAARWGGRFGFSDNKPYGTVFTISFPLISDNAVGDKYVGKKAIERRILIVDDDEEIRNVLDDMLKIEGFRAENCSNGYTAMELLEKGSFNMVITDLGMPGMSGYDLARYVREKYREMEIVLLTGWGSTLDRDEKELKGIKAIISKPFHLNEILQLVRD